MASQYPLLFLLATLSIFLTLTISVPNYSLDHYHKGIEGGFRAALRRIDSDKNLTTNERVKREIERGERRARWFSGSYADVETPVYSGGGEFLMVVGIGTQKTDYRLIMDTGSDFTWTQCAPCQQCYNQPDPIFNPQQSSTYSSVSCNSQPCSTLASSCYNNACYYTYGYGDKSKTLGYLGSDTFTFKSGSVSNMLLGCGYDNSGTFGNFNEDGLCGLAHSPISLVGQLAVKKFAYCLTSPGSSASSTLLMGSYANTLSVPITKTTKIIINPVKSLFDYISMTGISVNGQLLNIPSSVFAIKQDGSGGMIADSGTTYTQLPTSAFNNLANTLIKVVNLRYFAYNFFKLCFQLPQNSIKLPQVTFHFDGMDLELSDENVWIDIGGGVLCLTMSPTNDIAILGNRQQTNWVVVHDLGTRLFGFAKTNCDGF